MPLPSQTRNGSTSLSDDNTSSRPTNQTTAPLTTPATIATITTTPSIAAPTTASASLDDMALELFAAKESESEVERLQTVIERLNKELEHKDAIISRLQDKVTSLLMGNRDSDATMAEPLDISNASMVLASTSQPRNGAREVALQCSICVDYFASPFTVECGHTFCFTCLHSWLLIQKSCPTCRTKLLRRPTLSFNIREQVQASLSHLPEAERSQALEKLAADEKSIKVKQRQGDLWEGIFKPLGLDGFGGNIIVDREDGVRRCASCGWEVRGGSCVNCRTLFSDVEEDSDQSQEDSDQDSEEEPDEYDSHDSFIDDDADSDIAAMDEDSDRDSDDLEFSGKSSNDDSDEGIRLRHTRSNIKSMTKRRHGKSTATIVLSSSEEDESDESPAVETIESYSDESEDEVVRSPQHSRRNSRKGARRSIFISDEEEEEEEEEEEDEDDVNRYDESEEDDVMIKGGRKKSKTVISSDDDSSGEEREQVQESESSEDDDFVVAPRKKRRL
ncbi:E3 ubiquitin ligase [Gryganskiella cystojenkinii]|nr:E3 ubiquitin ligase [Gryganskiella cystojenkinii]